MRFRLRLGAATVLFVLLGGCVSIAARPALPRPTAPAPAGSLPAGWVRPRDAAQGFAVALPDTWDYVIRDSSNLDADMQRVGQHSTDLSTYFKRAFAADAQVRLIAADSGSLASGFATNEQVIASDLGATGSAPSLEDLVDAKLRLLSRPGSVVQPVKRSADHLAGIPAVRLDYALTGAGSPMVRSYLAVYERGGRSFEYELTMGALPEAAGTTFPALAQLFTLFPASVATPVRAPAGNVGGDSSPSPRP